MEKEHGGARKGAGRKPLGKIVKSISISLKEEEWEDISRISKNKGKRSVTTLITQITKEYIEKHK